MLDMDWWLDRFMEALEDLFGGRIWFVGLQGSRGRGEGSDASDIDMVVILDKLQVEDIGTYSAMLDGLPHRELSCGFLSGRKELMNWEPSDLFHLYHDTTPLRGSLDELLPLMDGEALNRAIKVGACSLYHGCVHNMIHGRSELTLQGLYKSAAFLAQAICLRESGRFIRNQRDLPGNLSTEDGQIVDTFLRLKNGRPVEFDEMSRMLFEWAGKWIGA